VSHGHSLLQFRRRLCGQLRGEHNRIGRLWNLCRKRCQVRSVFQQIRLCQQYPVCPMLLQRISHNTNSNEVCVQSSEVTGTIVDVCGTSGGIGCATCTDTNYACVSKSQFARCSKEVLIDANVYSCNTDEICSSTALQKYGNICVPSCVRDFVGFLGNYIKLK